MEVYSLVHPLAYYLTLVLSPEATETVCCCYCCYCWFPSRTVAGNLSRYCEVRLSFRPSQRPDFSSALLHSMGGPEEVSHMGAMMQ